jgi:hypothetical protein
LEGAGHATTPAGDGATGSVAGLPVLATVFSFEQVVTLTLSCL